MKQRWARSHRRFYFIVLFEKEKTYFFSSMRIGGFAQDLQRNFALLVRTIGCCLKILINGGSGDFFHTRNSGIEMWTNFQLTECWCFRYCCLAFWNLKKNKKTILWSHATSTWRSEIWGGTTWQNVNRSPHLQKWRRHCHATVALLWSATSPNRIKHTDCDRGGPTWSRSAQLESP